MKYREFLITQCKARSVVNDGNNNEFCALQDGASVPVEWPLGHNRAMGDS
jgi:hypothetical protein